MKTNKKQFIVFISVTFILAWIIQIAASALANSGNAQLFTISLSVTMFMPLIGAVIARFPFNTLGWKPKLKGRVRYFLFALWMPVLLGILGCLLFFAVFPGSFDSELSTVRNTLESAGAMAQLEGAGLSVPMYFMLSIISAVTYAPFINMLFALGEEVGWRGVMYPYLKEKLGTIKGRIAGGIIWGIWHWPVIILAGYEYGKDYFGAPFLGPVVFCCSTVFFGILLDYVYEKTETIWAPSLLHGAINALSFFVYLVKPEYSYLAVFGPAFIGIIGMIPMAVLSVYLCRKAKPSI